MRDVAFLLALSLLPAPLQDEDSGPRNTAHVKAYPELPELTLKAPAHAAAGRYADAIALYEDALERHPDTVVPLDRVRARGVREFILEQVRAWPEEGREAYRRRTDPLAEHLFEGAKRGRDERALERILERYPFSSFADDALALIGNLALDAGEEDRAAAAFERLSAAEPGSPHAAVAAARLGVAYARAGRKADLVELAVRAGKALPDAELRVGGDLVPLATHLRKLAARTVEGRPRGAALALPAWEMMGGAPGGTRLAEPGLDLPKLAWSVPVGLPRFDADDDLGIRRGASLTPTADFRPLFPAVSDGILYVQNGLSLAAYHLFARQPERLWEFRVPPPAGEIMFDNRVVYTVSVRDGRVFANLVTAAGRPEDQLGYVRVKFPFPRRALFAFDAVTGRPLWRFGGRPSAGPAARPLADRLRENATFSTAPTPDGGLLYAAAILQDHPTDPFEHYLLCLDPETGALLWATFVASGGTEINLFGNSTRESLASPVSLDGDSAYVCTNHGVVAALDRRTGRIRWTHRYRQLPVMPTRSVYVTKNRLEWIASPPLPAQGVLAVAPTDSPFLYALDARSGELRWERPRGREVRAILGAHGTVLALGGDQLELVDLRGGETVGQPGSDQLLGTGRGVVAEDAIYVPCRDKLRRVGWDNAWDESRARAWPGGPGEGGNLLVVDGAVVLASQDAVHVHYDRRDQDQLVREELKKDPENPVVLYRAGLRLLQSGSPAEAAVLLARAVERSAGSARPEEERLHRAARKRLFAVSIEAGRAELAAGRPDAAAARFLSARSTAADAASQVEASMLVAQTRLAKAEPARAVAEYQRLLAEQGGELAGGVRVSELARNAIDAVIRVHGRAAYAAVEESARLALEAARREGTPGALEAVHRGYPNSLAAEEALFASASAHGRLGRGDDEAAALRLFLREYPVSTRSAETHAALVRVLERQGRWVSAESVLRKLARSFPDAEVSDGAQRVRARDFAERRLRSEAYLRRAAAAPLPALSPPLKPAFAHTETGYRQGVPLLPEGAPPAAASGLLLMNYGTGIKALDAERGGELWHVRVPSGVAFAAWLEDALVVGAPSAVLRLDPRTGRAEWTYEASSRMRGFSLGGPLLYFHGPDPRNDSLSRVTALDATRGAVAWTQAIDGTPTSRIRPAGETVVLATMQPNVLQVLEAETGRRLETETPVGLPLLAQIVHLAEGRVVLHAEGRQLEAYSLPQGALLWKASLERTSTRAVEAGPEGIVLLASRRAFNQAKEEVFLALIHPENGKIVRLKEGLDVGDPRFMLLDGPTAVVVSREADGSVGARGIRLSDFSTAWTAAAGDRDSTLLPPLLARDHVVVAMTWADAKRQYGWRAALLDKQGRVVQNIVSEPQYETPPNVAASNGRLIFSVDNKVDVHR
jgi:outer membrane protein assembly factor BamB/TolA-binding protein